MADDLEALCNMCSGSDHLPGLSSVAQWLEQYFSELQWQTKEYCLPTWTVVDDLGNRTEQHTHKALRWEWDGKKTNLDTPRLLLSLHYDTVYGANSPCQNCTRFEVDSDERMRGPGVIDAKGGIVVIKWALLGAIKFLDMDRIRISVVLTPDEEIGSPATKSLWQTNAPEFKFAMLYEPT